MGGSAEGLKRQRPRSSVVAFSLLRNVISPLVQHQLSRTLCVRNGGGLLLLAA